MTKADVTDPARAAREAQRAAAAAPTVVRVLGAHRRRRRGRCARRSTASPRACRAAAPHAGEPLLHVDRAFTIRGAGHRGDRHAVVGRGRARRPPRAARRPAPPVRVRVACRSTTSPSTRADAGQRVALNLVGVELREVARGDVVAARARWRPRRVLDCDARAARRRATAMRAHVHHGTRETPARLADLGGGLWQARLEQPLLGARGDRVVVRSIAPPDTLGGGVVLDPRARAATAGAPTRSRAWSACARGEPEPAPAPAAPPPPRRRGRASRRSPDSALALEERLRAAGHEPPNAADLDRRRPRAPCAPPGAPCASAARCTRTPTALAAVRARVEAVIAADGAITLARLRDELQTSRKFAQALLEHLDAERVTKRLPDDSRVLRRRAIKKPAAYADHPAVRAFSRLGPPLPKGPDPAARGVAASPCLDAAAPVGARRRAVRLGAARRHTRLARRRSTPAHSSSAARSRCAARFSRRSRAVAVLRQPAHRRRRSSCT